MTHEERLEHEIQITEGHLAAIAGGAVVGSNGENHTAWWKAEYERRLKELKELLAKCRT